MAAVAVVITSFFAAIIITMQHGLLTTWVARLMGGTARLAARTARFALESDPKSTNEWPRKLFPYAVYACLHANFHPYVSCLLVSA